MAPSSSPWRRSRSEGVSGEGVHRGRGGVARRQAVGIGPGASLAGAWAARGTWGDGAWEERRAEGRMVSVADDSGLGGAGRGPGS